MNWNALKKQAWRNRFRLANLAISALVLAFAIVASAAAYASMPHPLLGALLLATIGLVALRSFLMAWMQRVHRRLSRSYRALSRIVMAMQSEPELPALLDLMARRITEVIEADRCSIFLVDREREELWSRVALEAGEIRLGLREGIVGEVATTGEVLNIPDAYADPRFCREIDRQTGYRTRNLLCAPIQDLTGEIIGVFELINKQGGPFTLQDEELLQTVCSHTALAIESARMQEEIVSQRVEVELARRRGKELELAREVQRHFLKRPPEIPGLEIAAACLPASEVSGDYYDFLPVDEDRWLFILADVAGHGVPAALLMSAAMMSTALFLHPRNGFPGARKSSDELLRELVRQVDGFLTEKFGGSSFVTAALLLYDCRVQEFRYVSLGHPPALLCPHGDPGVIALDGGDQSSYLPWMTSRYFPPEAVEGRLSGLEPWVCRTRPGETLVLYSDGVIEARDGQREEYGLRRFKEALWEARGLSAQGVMKACLQDLGRFAGSASQGDDVTLVVVRASGVTTSQRIQVDLVCKDSTCEDS